MSNTPYKDDAENWAAQWDGYYPEVENFHDISTVVVRKGERTVRAWFEKTGKTVNKIADWGGEGTEDTIQQLMEWLNEAD